MTVVSGSSQCHIGDINLETWSNSSIRPSSSDALPTGSVVNGSISHTITASMTSFTDESDEVKSSYWLSCFLKLYLSPILPKKCLMVSLLTDISSPDLISWDVWKDSVPLKTYCCLFYWCEIYLCSWFFALVLLFYFEICCYHYLYICFKEMGSSVLVALTGLLHSFDVINTWHICDIEFSSAIALSLFVPHIDVTYIPETFLHHLPLCTSVSCFLQ